MKEGEVDIVIPDENSPVNSTARLIGGKISRVAGHCQLVAAYPETALMPSYESPTPAEGGK